jgi:hypothetical protein
VLKYIVHTLFYQFVFACPPLLRRLEGELDGAANLRVFAGTGVILELLLRLE